MEEFLSKSDIFVIIEQNIVRRYVDLAEKSDSPSAITSSQ